MTEERITEVRTPEGDTHTTHTTVISDEPRSGGGSGWVIAIVLVIALVVGIWAVTNIGGAEAAKDNAVAGAANQVGDAAQQVGDAAQKAADSVAN